VIESYVVINERALNVRTGIVAAVGILNCINHE